MAQDRIVMKCGNMLPNTTPTKREMMSGQLPENVVEDNKLSGLGVVIEVTCLECGYIGPMAKVGTTNVPKSTTLNIIRIIAACLALLIVIATIRAYYYAAFFIPWFYVPLGVSILLLYKCLPSKVSVVRCPKCRECLNVES